MNKDMIKKALTEEFVSGEKATKRAQTASGKENKDYYKEVTKKMGDYDKNLKQEDEDKIDTPKEGYEGSEKEYHDEMEIRNGQEMLQYDREPSDTFKDRAIKAIEGDSTMGNKTYTGDENGNTESVWGASDDEFGKKLVKTAKASSKKRDDATPTLNQFGDDIETSPGQPKGVKRKIATESMKRIKFKSPFHGVENAINLIPEAFKVNGKQFELTDGNEKYKVLWENDKASILEAGDKNLVKEDVKRIKTLMGYKSENTLGSLDGKARVNENNTVKAGIPQGFTNEAEDDDDDFWTKDYDVAKDYKDKKAKEEEAKESKKKSDAEVE